MTSKKKTAAAAGRKATKTKAVRAAKAAAAAARPAAVPAPGASHGHQTPAPAKPPKKMSALDAAAIHRLVERGLLLAEVGVVVERPVIGHPGPALILHVCSRFARLCARS